MAILHSSIRPYELCILAISKPKIFNFWILLEDFMRINDTLVFF
jgi:hypothetical protein